MSATIIEMLIQEASRDGVLSQTEIESIHKEALSLGVSKALVDSLVEDHLAKLKASADEKAENERLKREKDENIKYDLFEKTFEKLVRGWICKSTTRILDKTTGPDSYITLLRREAQQKQIEMTWLDAWILKLEKSEQEIAGIKPQGFFDKIKNIFK